MFKLWFIYKDAYTLKHTNQFLFSILLLTPINPVWQQAIVWITDQKEQKTFKSFENHLSKSTEQIINILM